MTVKERKPTKKRMQQPSDSAQERLLNNTTTQEFHIEDDRVALTSSQKLNVHETLHIKQIPLWMFDNAYLLTGYRQEMGNYLDCFKSLFYVHNETGNIYSHMIGSGLFIVWLIIMFLSSADLVQSTVWLTRTTDILEDIPLSWKDYAVVACFMVSAITCMGLSFLFHTCHCHSFEVSKAWNKMDFAGIAGLIA
ncbi:Adiponectin receptor protein 1 [Podochytrium sp. JEL0797]|nr:Adiponectin receptor protein 1 [Podochytrium sp. JEL0797]